MSELNKTAKKQTAASRKMQYKDLIDQGSNMLEKIETNDVLESFSDIVHIIDTCSQLGEEFMQRPKVENATEYLLDAQVVKMSHDLICGTAEQLGNAEFSDQEFAESLMNFILDQGTENFDKLADEGAKCCKGLRYSLPMLGTFEREERPVVEKEKKERLKRQKMDDLKKPENIAALKKTDKGAEKINSYFIQIEQICKERGGIVPYYELITHPDDFMATVDNAFQVSFLIRDNFIGLKKISGEICVYLIDNPVRSFQSGISAETVQCVSSINPKMWRDNIQKYKIENPLLICDIEQTENSFTQITQIDEDSDSD